jgi:alkanesulfonate monooxygenase SsuD/methylene tetrahydromethanopterin reductase-like flavin-dependent oxidoreductase (luciferase family)
MSSGLRKDGETHSFLSQPSRAWPRSFGSEPQSRRWPDHQCSPLSARCRWVSSPRESSSSVLGPQNWHNLNVQKPVAQIREYIECIRSLLRATPSNPVSFAGTYYKVTDYVPFLPAPVTEFPIYLAGVNRLMIQLAGSHTDGLILGPLNSALYLRDIVHPNLQRGISKRNGGTCELCLLRLCAVDRDAARARNLVRHAIAFYSVLPYYDVVLTPLGFSTQAAAIRAAFGRGDYAAMISAVSDDMVAALSFAGTRDDVRAQAREFDGLYDRLILGSPFFGVGQEETRANHAGLLETFAQ